MPKLHDHVLEFSKYLKMTWFDSYNLYDFAECISPDFATKREK